VPVRPAKLDKAKKRKIAEKAELQSAKKKKKNKLKKVQVKSEDDDDDEEEEDDSEQEEDSEEETNGHANGDERKITTQTQDCTN